MVVCVVVVVLAAGGASMAGAVVVVVVRSVVVVTGAGSDPQAESKVPTARKDPAISRRWMGCVFMMLLLNSARMWWLSSWRCW